MISYKYLSNCVVDERKFLGAQLILGHCTHASVQCDLWSDCTCENVVCQSDFASSASSCRRASTSCQWWLDGFGARSSHAGNCTGLLSNIGLFLSTGNIPFPLSTPIKPFRLLSTAFVPISPCLASIYDLYFFSSIVEENRSLLMNLHVVQFLLVLSCQDSRYPQSIRTDFPRYHRMESLTSTTELHPILCRIPECCHHEEQQRINQRNPMTAS